MFARSPHRTLDNIQRSAVLSVLGLLLVLLALAAPSRAGAVTRGSIVPAGAVDGVATASASSGKHGTGAVLPKREHRPAAPMRNLATSLASVDLSQYSVSVQNQGPLASCVTWAIDYALVGWYARRYNMPVQQFNPMYAYSQIHLSTAVDGGGSNPDAALNLAQGQGNDTLTHYDNGSTQDFTHQPTTSERANAAYFKIAGWRNLFSTSAGYGSTGKALIQNELAAGRPVVILTRVRAGMDYTHMGHTTDALDDDVRSAPQPYAHEVMATGYDSLGLWFQNSWGGDYGYKGYGRLSWAVVAQDVMRADVITGINFTTANFTTADTTAPVMGAVDQKFLPDGLMTNTTVPVQLSWSASDASGIGAYEVWVKTDGGSFAKDTNIAPTATVVNYDLAVGHTYQLAVRARDTAGNWSASYAYSASVTPGVADDKAFVIGNPWGRYNLTDTYGGTYAATDQAGAWFQYSATGRDIALIGPRFSAAGRATLYCDGTSYGIIDTYNATTIGRKVLAWCHFTQGGQHTMKIVVEGTATRAWVGVDAFATLS